jgi:hypothetical protein
MFFKSDTIFKVLLTRKGAENYIARHFAGRFDITIQEIDNKFFVVG